VKDVLLVVFALLLVVGVALNAVYVYSRQQLSALQGDVVYTTPEEGMLGLAAKAYIGLERLESVHAGYEPCFLGNLCFVEARVWADSRVDGKVVQAEGDSPGGFFLRRGNGWIWVLEGRRPWFVALGQRLFGDGGTGAAHASDQILS
jgi:hypothetical protein